MFHILILILNLKKMKRILYILVFMIFLLSCEKDFEYNLDKSPTERMTEAIDKLTDVLSGSEYGWKTTIITRGKTASAGDFFVMKFAPIEGGSCGQVTIANGFGSETSEFDIYHSTGVVLNFNTFNEVFHWLAKPTEWWGTETGLGGNIEYILMKNENGKLTLKGKDNENEMILEKASEQDWDMTDIQRNYASVQAVLARNFSGITVTKGFGATDEEPFFAKFRDVTITILALPSKKGQFYGLDYSVDGKQVQSTVANFVFTHDELILAEPIFMGTDTVDRFTYNKDLDLWTIGNEGIEGYLSGFDLPPMDSPRAFDTFLAVMDDRWYGWPIYHDDYDNYGKIAEFLTEIRNNVPELQYLQINEHVKLNGEDIGRGLMFIGDGDSRPYVFIPVDYIKQGESEMKIVRNGDVISNIPNINDLLDNNPHVLKFMNAFFSPQGWRLYMQEGGSEDSPYYTISFYNIEDPSINMRKVF